MLAAGLLMGEGAVAGALPGLGGDDGTHSPGDGSPTSGNPVGKITDNVTDTVKNAVQGVTSTPGPRAQPGQQPSTGPTSTLGSGRQPGQQVSIGAISPTTGASGRTPEDQDDAGLVPADTYPIGAVPDVVPPVTNVIAPVTWLGGGARY